MADKRRATKEKSMRFLADHADDIKLLLSAGHSFAAIARHVGGGIERDDIEAFATESGIAPFARPAGWCRAVFAAKLENALLDDATPLADRVTIFKTLLRRDEVRSAVRLRDAQRVILTEQQRPLLLAQQARDNDTHSTELQTTATRLKLSAYTDAAMLDAELDAEGDEEDA